MEFQDLLAEVSAMELTEEQSDQLFGTVRGEGDLLKLNVELGQAQEKLSALTEERDRALSERAQFRTQLTEAEEKLSMQMSIIERQAGQLQEATAALQTNERNTVLEKALSEGKILPRQRAERWFTRYGSWALLFSWLPVVGDPLCLVSGSLKTPWPSFTLLVATGKGLRYAGVALLTLQGGQLLS